MTAQLELFNQPKARHDSPDTSRDAARAVQQHAGALENIILTEFCLHDGMTDDELASWLPSHHPPTVKTCRSRLSGRGLLVATSEKRPSNRGREQTVWRLATARGEQ